MFPGEFSPKGYIQEGIQSPLSTSYFFLGLDADPVEMKDGKGIRYSWHVFILYSLSIYVYLYTDEPI